MTNTTIILIATVGVYSMFYLTALRTNHLKRGILYRIISVAVSCIFIGYIICTGKDSMHWYNYAIVLIFVFSTIYTILKLKETIKA